MSGNVGSAIMSFWRHEESTRVASFQMEARYGGQIPRPAAAGLGMTLWPCAQVFPRSDVAMLA